MKPAFALAALLPFATATALIFPIAAQARSFYCSISPVFVHKVPQPRGNLVKFQASDLTKDPRDGVDWTLTYLDHRTDRYFTRQSEMTFSPEGFATKQFTASEAEGPLEHARCTAVSHPYAPPAATGSGYDPGGSSGPKPPRKGMLPQ